VRSRGREAPEAPEARDGAEASEPRLRDRLRVRPRDGALPPPLARAAFRPAIAGAR